MKPNRPIRYDLTKMLLQPVLCATISGFEPMRTVLLAGDDRVRAMFVVQKVKQSQLSYTAAIYTYQT